jgi:transposase-like protein
LTPAHVLTPEVEIIADGGGRRCWTADERLRIVRETLDGTTSISVAARRSEVGANLLYRWRRLMPEGGSVAVTDDDHVTGRGLPTGSSAR